MQCTCQTRSMVFVVFLLVSAFPYAYTSAATNGLLCDDPHTATAVDIAAGYPAGSQVCPNDYVESGVTEESGEAKIYLNSLPKRALSQCAPPNEANITRLNPTFAICAARFFRAYTARYGGVLITSAFRDGAPGSSPRGGTESANQCAGGAPGSNHMRGIAMDVNPANGVYQTMWRFASENPQFGVCFPFQDGRTSGYSDRPHMVLAGSGGSEAALCAGQGVTNPCSGTNFNPDSIRNVSVSPTAILADTIRNFLNPQPDQEPGEGQIEPTVYPLLTGFLSGDLFPRPQTSPQSQNTASYKPTTMSNTLLTRSAGAVPSRSSASSTSTSVYERINLYATTPRTGTQASSTTTTPLILVVNATDAARIQSEVPRREDPIVYRYEDESEYRLTPPVQETFTSPDLNGNPPSSSIPPQQMTTYQTILADMGSIASQILAYLRPFGRPVTEDDFHE